MDIYDPNKIDNKLARRAYILLVFVVFTILLAACLIVQAVWHLLVHVSGGIVLALTEIINDVDDVAGAFEDFFSAW